MTTRYKVWQPGDGLHCTYQTHEARNAPCTRPVAVRWRTTNQGKERREVVCAMHILDGNVSGLSADAEREAAEAIIAAHYDEYRTLVRKLADEKVDQAVAEVPEELRALARAAVDEKRAGG